MNLKNLLPKGRALLEAINEPAADEKYEIVDTEEDGDTITVTFSRDISFDDEADETDDED